MNLTDHDLQLINQLAELTDKLERLHPPHDYPVSIESNRDLIKTIQSVLPEYVSELIEVDVKQAIERTKGEIVECREMNEGNKFVPFKYKFLN